MSDRYGSRSDHLKEVIKTTAKEDLEKMIPVISEDEAAVAIRAVLYHQEHTLSEDDAQKAKESGKIHGDPFLVIDS